MSKSFAIKFDFSGLFGALDGVTEKSASLVRVAAQAGAEDLYFEARLRCPESQDSHYFYGSSYAKYGTFYGSSTSGVAESNMFGPIAPFKPGNLRNSIYHAYSKDNSKEGEKATYHISWNYKKAPYGHIIENGGPKRAAHPFLRPAYDARSKTSLQIASGVYEEEMRAYLASLK